MKYAIVFSSQTGNTKQLAEVVSSVLPQADLCFFGSPSQEALQAVRELNTQVGIPAKLSDAGVTDEYFAQMTEDAMKSGNIAINPQKTVREDILALYKEAL